MTSKYLRWPEPNAGRRQIPGPVSFRQCKHLTIPESVFKAGNSFASTQRSTFLVGRSGAQDMLSCLKPSIDWFRTAAVNTFGQNFIHKVVENDITRLPAEYDSESFYIKSDSEDMTAYLPRTLVDHFTGMPLVLLKNVTRRL